ncbi:PD-(D/E)XK nuclease family protein [Algisphaera agarilytica]|uniref:RecB family exonuclease n=1 Tax=Algisphaera agarilytica TaxID=1385975 RepID=A0A7X0H7P0_9BACT|nr:PD-(D/E)XK nuclease family protein [Algisphaera agarilytica]MBB6430812.1 RecB family exonuclease [Algisphaera agarilytica]
MADKRVFLGWEQAVLPAAAAWLVGRYGLDLGGVVVAVPVARAGRRLEELLVDEAERRAEMLTPPRVVTAGQLPELLIESEDDPVDDLTSVLTRAVALREADRAVFTQVFPYPPDDTDTVAWVRLADQMQQLSDELAAARLTPGHVVELAAQRGVDLGLSEGRWQAIAQLDTAYRQSLGRPDRQAARQLAIEQRQCRSDRPIVLVGLVDLSAQLTGMLEQLDDVTPLVPAPDSHAQGFDVLGGLVVDYWQEQTVDVADFRLADQPSDQAIELVRVLGGWADEAAAQDVTVGLGDEEAAGSLGRAIELAGTPARPAAGRPVTQSAPVVLLQTLARFVTQQRISDLAELVRHPDVTGVIGDEHWATLLDEYTSTYLQADTRHDWRGDDATRETLGTLTERLYAVLPEAHDTPQPLPAWSSSIARTLAGIYGTRDLDTLDDHSIIEALTQLAQALDQQAQLDLDAPSTPRVTFAQAVSLTLSRLARQRIPEPGGTSAVELLGFLEMPWDDASRVVLTDVNEGRIPDSRHADAFLPDSLRRSLDLPDNARRYARAALYLNIVLQTRPAGHAVLLACRHSADGDPLVPSRLLLACDPATRTQRVKDFYPKDESASTSPAPLLIAPGGENRFLIPRPLLDEPPITSLRVTAFRDYLACPYRFYLKHVLRLGALDDRAVELDALAYGNLTHDVLEAFGRSDLIDATDGGPIEEFLNDTLTTRVRQKFGRDARPAVRVQIAQLRERLSQFADQQARLSQDGWRIRQDLIETSLEATVTLDGQAFTVTGKIDRVDEHPDHGFRLLDYKTSDAGDSPQKTHLSKGQWRDLQLPLYLTLVGPIGIDGAQLGYFNLPKAAANAGVTLADWGQDALAEAMAQRDLVIRGVRGGVFWPPSLDVPSYADAVSGITADGAMGRPELIAQSGSDLNNTGVWRER